MEAKACGCPVIVDEEWHRTTFSWEGRTFFQKEVKFFFKNPVGIEERTREAAEEIEKRGYALDDPSIILVQQGSFKGAVLIGILEPDDQTPEVVTFDARPLVSVVSRSKEPKVAPGLKALKQYVSESHRSIADTYIWYTTCPNCYDQERTFTTVLIARTT
ncbi:MAG: hydrolase [Pseudomonadota bacterium]